MLNMNAEVKREENNRGSGLVGAKALKLTDGATHADEVLRDLHLGSAFPDGTFGYDGVLLWLRLSSKAVSLPFLRSRFGVAS